MMIECCAEHRLQLIAGRCPKCRDAQGHSFVLDMQSKVLVPYEELFSTVDASLKFGVDDSLAMDTGHGDRRPPLTEEEIVDRAAERQYDSTLLLAILAMCLVSAISLYKPIHTWLHAHLELLAGILLGSVLEAWMWLMYCRRPWVKR